MRLEEVEYVAVFDKTFGQPSSVDLAQCLESRRFL